MKNKRIIIIVAIVLVVVGGLTIFFVIRNNAKKAKDLEASNKIQITSNTDLEHYVGYWFISEDNHDIYMHVKEVNYNSLKFDLVYSSTSYINDIELSFENGVGDLDYEDGDSSLEGQFTLYDKQIVFNITESTYEGADLGTTFIYGYQQNSLEFIETPTKPIQGPAISSSYAGTWYENYDTDFKNSLIVVGIDGQTINIYLTINDVSFKVLKAEIVDGHGSFETLTRDEESKISGYVVLGDSYIELKVVESTVENIANDTDYMFKLKSTPTSVSNYYNKWYMTEEIDEKNYVQIKSSNKGMVVFDLMYGDKAQILNVSATLKNNIASFECVGSDERVLAGNVVFDKDKVVVAFNNSTVGTIQNGTILEFKYKGGS